MYRLYPSRQENWSEFILCIQANIVLIIHNSADEVLYSMTETHKCKPLKVEMLSDVEYARNRRVNFLKTNRRVNNYLHLKWLQCTISVHLLRAIRAGKIWGILSAG